MLPVWPRQRESFCWNLALSMGTWHILRVSFVVNGGGLASCPPDHSDRESSILTAKLPKPRAFSPVSPCAASCRSSLRAPRGGAVYPDVLLGEDVLLGPGPESLRAPAETQGHGMTVA